MTDPIPLDQIGQHVGLEARKPLGQRIREAVLGPPPVDNEREKSVKTIRKALQDMPATERPCLCKQLGLSPAVVDRYADQGVEPPLDELVKLVPHVMPGKALVNGFKLVDGPPINLNAPADAEAKPSIRVPRHQGLVPVQQPSLTAHEAGCAYNLLRDLPDGLISIRALREGLRYSVDFGTDDLTYRGDRLGKILQILIDMQAVFSAVDQDTKRMTFFRVADAGLQQLKRQANPDNPTLGAKPLGG